MVDFVTSKRTRNMYVSSKESSQVKCKFKMGAKELHRNEEHERGAAAHAKSLRVRVCETRVG